MRPSDNPLWKPDADGFDARPVILPIATGVGVLLVAAEVYFALAWPDYDVRTGSLRIVLFFLAGHLAFGTTAARRASLSGGRTRQRKVVIGGLFIVGTVLVLFPGPARWPTFCVGVASLIAAVLAARMGLAPHVNQETPVPPA